MSTATTEQPDYIIVDTLTGRQVGKRYGWASRNRARARADKLDLEYGACRYRAFPADLARWAEVVQ